MNRKQRRQTARIEPATASRQAPSAGTAAILSAKAFQQFQAGRLIEAMDLYQQALVADPRHIGSLHHLGLIAIKIGRPEIAVDLVGQAITLNETNATLHHDICFALAALDRHAEAASHAQRAIALKPEYTNAYLQLGDSLLKLRKLDEAIATYRQSLVLDPANAEVHNNLAEALFAQGHLTEAAGHFKEALRLKPDLTTAYNNLATIYFLGGDTAHALNVIVQGLQIEETPLLKTMFATYLRHAPSIPDTSTFRQYVVRTLSEPWGRPGTIVLACIALVKCDPRIKRSIDGAAAAWPQRLSCTELFGADGLCAVASDPILRALLQNAYVSDIPLERFLTLARSALLDAATAYPQPMMPIQRWLLPARLHGNVSSTSMSLPMPRMRQAKVATLRDQVTAALQSGDPIAALPLAVIASYEPLYSIPGFEALLARSWSGDDGRSFDPAGPRTAGRARLCERTFRN